MFSRFSKSLAAIILLSLVMGVVVLPGSMKSNWPDNSFFRFFTKPEVTLGLDLQGGTQLDYRIDLRNAEAKNSDSDSTNDVRVSDIVEGVRATIERRVNGLGVSEPQIFLSQVGDEQHIIVELAGVKDVEKAKQTVGKTIQLEFKERKTEMDPTEKDKINAEAKTTLEKALVKDADFDLLANSTQTGDKKIEYRAKKATFESELPSHYKDVFSKLKDKETHSAVIEGSDGFLVSGEGQLTEKKGLYIVQLVSKEVKEHIKKEYATFEEAAKEAGATVEKLTGKTRQDFDEETNGKLWALNSGQKTDILTAGNELRVYQVTGKTEAADQIKASHILISYQGAERAKSEIKRTKEEAKKEAERILAELKAKPDQFAEMAKKYTDDPSGKDSGGDLGYFGKGQMTPAFESAAFALNVGDISSVIETEFGYHIIKSTDKKETKESIDVSMIKLAKNEENQKKLEEALKKIDGYDVTVKEPEFTYNELFFDLTPDPWKSTGLDGSHFKMATVTYGELGAPEVSIRFDSEGADLFEKITERLVNQPLAIFVGGELISAPNVNQKISGGNAVITGRFNIKEALQLANDLNTGAIDAPVVLAGQYTISATLGESALRVSLFAGLIGLIALAVYMIFYYRLMGFFAVLALCVYSIIMIFILKTTGIVMTLAGVAGIILSIGMAVDANVLIFERTREELNLGKNFSAATAAGFERAWSSIRDSNVSSLITCAILWSFGNSIIRGFAFMLALGIVISMFTAINVTRAFLRNLIGSSLTKNHFLLGTKNVEVVNR